MFAAVTGLSDAVLSPVFRSELFALTRDARKAGWPEVFENSGTGRQPDAAVICPSGKILSSPPLKNNSVYQKSESDYVIRHPVLLRGALAIVTNVGTGKRWTQLRR